MSHRPLLFSTLRLPSLFSQSVATRLLAGCLSGAAPLPAMTAVAQETASDDSTSATANETEGEWIQLFNGKDLTGWTPKFVGHELGDNHNNTFRVKDGLLCADFDQWDQFNETFGHLFYETPHSHYRIRAVYRFVGEQTEGGPGWAWRNNGFMLHCLPPEDMTLDQEFPTSMEAQMLGANEGQDRATGNACTPGTHLILDGQVIEGHVVGCRNGTSYPGDQWVTYEVIVRGDHFQHLIDGKIVLDYYARLDPIDNPKPLDHGYISIQAESHGTQFKTIELLPLPGDRTNK